MKVNGIANCFLVWRQPEAGLRSVHHSSNALTYRGPSLARSALSAKIDPRTSLKAYSSRVVLTDAEPAPPQHHSLSPPLRRYMFNIAPFVSTIIIPYEDEAPTHCIYVSPRTRHRLLLKRYRSKTPRLEDRHPLRLRLHPLLPIRDSRRPHRARKLPLAELARKNVSGLEGREAEKR